MLRYMKGILCWLIGSDSFDGGNVDYKLYNLLFGNNSCYELYSLSPLMPGGNALGPCRNSIDEAPTSAPPQTTPPYVLCWYQSGPFSTSSGSSSPGSVENEQDISTSWNKCCHRRKLGSDL